MTNKTHVIKVIVPHKPGILAGISRDMADAGINIEHLSAVEAGRKAVIVLAVSGKEKRAIDLLHARGYHVLEEKGLIIRLKDVPGALAAVAERLAKEGINITSTSGVERAGGRAYIALTADDPAAARRVLKDVIV